MSTFALIWIDRTAYCARRPSFCGPRGAKTRFGCSTLPTACRSWRPRITLPHLPLRPWRAEAVAEATDRAQQTSQSDAIFFFLLDGGAMVLSKNLHARRPVARTGDTDAPHGLDWLVGWLHDLIICCPSCSHLVYYHVDMLVFWMKVAMMQPIHAVHGF